MTKIEMERTVANLLLEQRRFHRIGTELPPDKLSLLQRLLYRLGYTRMSRKSPKRYTEYPAKYGDNGWWMSPSGKVYGGWYGEYTHPEWLIEHHNHPLLKMPEYKWDDTTNSWSKDNVDPMKFAFDKGWVRMVSSRDTLHAHNDSVPFSETQKSKLVDHALENGLGNVQHNYKGNERELWRKESNNNGEQYRRHQQPKLYVRLSLSQPRPSQSFGGESVNEHDLHDPQGNVIGNIRIRDRGPMLHVDWIGGKGAFADPGKLGNEAMRSVHDAIANHYPNAQYLRGHRISGFRGAQAATGSAVVVPIRRRKKMSRTKPKKYAKFNASTPAHPLVHGFPIEHALRHVANSPQSSDDAKNLAVSVLKGHTEGLWGLHDELQATNHPILKAGYNWLNAADKLHLDKHTYTALEEAAARHRAAHPHTEHRIHGDEYAMRFTPEWQARRAATALANGSDHVANHVQHEVRSRVKELSPNSSDEEINESIQRHAHRATELSRRRLTGDSPDTSEGNALRHPTENKKPDSFSKQNEKATRYKKRVSPKKLDHSKLVSVGKFLSKNGAMPGYGQIFVKGSEVWYVGGDGDEWPDKGNYPEKKFKEVPGVTKVRYESEGFPPKKSGWLQITSGSIKGDREFPRKYSARPDQLHQMMTDLQSPEHAQHAAGLDDPLSGLRGVLADALDEHGRSGEAELLRTPGQHVAVSRGRVLPSRMTHHKSNSHLHEQFQKTTYDGPIEGEDDHGFTFWFPTHNIDNNRWYWSPGDGEGLHRTDADKYLSGWEHGMERTEDMPQDDDIFSKMKPSEVAYMNHHSESPLYKLSRKAKKYSLANKSNFIGALLKSSSPEHKMFVKRTKELAQRMGAKQTREFPALHDTPNQSVPGVAMAVYGNIQPNSAHALGSWINGLLPNGPGYAVFHSRPTGPDTLYRIRMEGSGYDARTKLDRAGISSRVFVPHRKGLDVLIPDKGNRMGQQVQSFAQQQKVPVQASPGHLTTVGSQDQAQARDTFRSKVATHESGGGAVAMRRRGRPDTYAITVTKPGTPKTDALKGKKPEPKYDLPGRAAQNLKAHTSPKMGDDKLPFDEDTTSKSKANGKVVWRSTGPDPGGVHRNLNWNWEKAETQPQSTSGASGYGMDEIYGDARSAKDKPPIKGSEGNKLHAWAHNHAFTHTPVFAKFLGANERDPKVHAFLKDAIIKAAKHIRERNDGSDSVTIAIGKTGKKLKIRIPGNPWKVKSTATKTVKIPEGKEVAPRLPIQPSKKPKRKLSRYERRRMVYRSSYV